MRGRLKTCLHRFVNDNYVDLLSSAHPTASFKMKRISLRSFFFLFTIVACCIPLVLNFVHNRSQPAMCYTYGNLHWDSNLNRGMDFVCAFRGSGRFDPPHKCVKVVFLHQITKPRHLLKRKQQSDADGVVDITALLATPGALDSEFSNANDLPMSSVLGWLEFKPGGNNFYMKCNGRRVLPREDSLLVLFMTDDTEPSWKWVSYSDFPKGYGVYPDYEALWELVYRDETP